MVLGREANMQIEKQVCSLELSKELKECGYKQEGLWLWVENSKDGTIRLWFQEAAEIEFNSYKNASFSKWKKQNTTMFDTCRVYSAPTATELLDRLPDRIYIKSNKCKMHRKHWDKIYELVIYKGFGYSCNYEGKICGINYEGNDLLKQTEDDNLACALAKMYIHLQKGGLI